jgi:hypothetical protein
VIWCWGRSGLNVEMGEVDMCHYLFVPRYALASIALPKYVCGSESLSERLVMIDGEICLVEGSCCLPSTLAFPSVTTSLACCDNVAVSSRNWQI